MRLCGLSRTFYLLEGDPDFDTNIRGEGVEWALTPTSRVRAHSVWNELLGCGLLRYSSGD